MTRLLADVEDLPEGNMLSGFAGALLSEATFRGVPAIALVTVRHRDRFGIANVAALGGALAAAVGREAFGTPARPAIDMGEEVMPENVYL
jgi:predicted ATP-grasp superfamily ATP-dependent carboligase